MKTKKARLRQKADKLWTEVCLKQGNYRCEICDKETHQVHHFVPKSQSKALRLDTTNGVCLCLGCHFTHHTKGDPFIHTQIIKQKGSDFIKYLHNKRYQPFKETTGWLEEKIETLNQLTNENT